MPVIKCDGSTIELDDEGFLKNADDWNVNAATAIARQLGIEELTEDRMKVINFMRDYYREFNAFPILRAVCKNIHQPKECVSEQFIDPLKAWKIAGLPNPVVIGSSSSDSAEKIYRMLVPD